MLSITVSNRRKKNETNRALICFFNEKTGKYEVIKENVLPDNLIDTKKYKPFGCYPKGEFLFVANYNKLIKLDKKGNYIDYKNLNGFENPHQIIITTDVKCFTNTENDLIELTYTDLSDLPIKDKNYLIDLKTLDNVVNDLKVDSHHVNSLCLNDNKIFFCLHNRGTKPSQYFYIDLETDKIQYICDYGFCSHNCEIEGDFLYTLSTRTGCLACINWKTGKGWETKLVDRKDYFLRGLVITKNHFIIGVSLTDTNANNGNSQILFVDRETKEIVNRYDIEGYNSVNDIRQI
jgi:hypothetical protein|tara:strand:+ start:90 stop:962 length:873 start_codon:yes stop_codon:yes gene_type:complete